MFIIEKGGVPDQAVCRKSAQITDLLSNAVASLQVREETLAPCIVESFYKCSWIAS